MKHIISANHIGFDSFHGKEFTRRHLLERRSMKDIVHTVHGISHALRITDVSYDKPNLLGKIRACLLQVMTHIILLLLITGKDADFRKIAFDEMLEHGITKTSRAARNHQHPIIKSYDICHELPFPETTNKLCSNASIYASWVKDLS